MTCQWTERTAAAFGFAGRPSHALCAPNSASAWCFCLALLSACTHQYTSVDKMEVAQDIGGQDGDDTFVVYAACTACCTLRRSLVITQVMLTYGMSQKTPCMLDLVLGAHYPNVCSLVPTYMLFTQKHEADDYSCCNSSFSACSCFSRLLYCMSAPEAAAAPAPGCCHCMCCCCCCCCC
jgi:hypothetical protein